MPIVMDEEPAPGASQRGYGRSAHDRLTLRSQLADLSLVSRWVQALASRHRFSDRTSFAIDLCLEEALSNVIRHGYADDPTRKLDVAFQMSPEGRVSFLSLKTLRPTSAPSIPKRRRLRPPPLRWKSLSPAARAFPSCANSPTPSSGSRWPRATA